MSKGSDLTLVTDLATFDATNDRLYFFDADAGITKALRSNELLRRLSHLASSDHTTTPVALTSADNLKRVTNIGASATVEFDLWSPTVGDRLLAVRVANYPVRLDPSGSETIGGGAAGKYLELRSAGAVLLECLSAGTWAVVASSAVLEYETDGTTEYGTTADIDLATFVSRYAHPGERVVFGAYDWQTNPPAQAQRRKNWRIFMEACLVANGGTGAHDGSGWYQTNDATAGMNRAAGGTVRVRGCLIHEPYADGEYAPSFATNGWTLPAAVQIVGTGAHLGNTSTWSEVSRTASRLVGYESPAARWYGLAAPAPTAGTVRHIGGWSIDNIALRATSASGAASAPDHVFHIAHSRSGGTTVSLNQFWRIGRLIIEMEPGAGANDQVGAYIQCGLNAQVDHLQVMGHANPGWEMVVTGLYDGTSLIADTTTIRFGQLLTHGSKRGVMFVDACCFAHEWNFENTLAQATGTTAKRQIVIGRGCDLVNIDTLWIEQAAQPDAGTPSGADQATLVVGGVDTEFRGPTSEAYPGNVRIGLFNFIGNTTYPPTAAIKLKKVKRFELGSVNAGGAGTALIHIAPIASGAVVGTYDSRQIQANEGDGSAGLVPRFLDDDSSGYATLFRDRARPEDAGTTGIIRRRAPETISAVTLSGTNPVSVTTSSAHYWQTGRQVRFSGVGGTTELNGNAYTITVTGATTFTLDGTDSSAFSAYTSGGYVYLTVLLYDDAGQVFTNAGMSEAPIYTLPAANYGAGVFSFRSTNTGQGIKVRPASGQSVSPSGSANRQLRLASGRSSAMSIVSYGGATWDIAAAVGAWVEESSAAAFAPKYVRFDGADVLTRSSALTGESADWTAITVVVAIEIHANNQPHQPILRFYNTPNTINFLTVQRDGPSAGANKMSIGVTDLLGAPVFNLKSNAGTGPISGDGTRHVFLISAQKGGSILMYDRDTSIVTPGSWASGDIVAPDADIIRLFGEADMETVDADVGIIAVYKTYFDFTQEVERRKFVDGSGNLVSPPAGSVIYMGGEQAATAWNAGTNQGSGGNFVMTGSVADAPETYAHEVVRFNAATYLNRGANLTGIADGQYGTIAVKFRLNSVGTTQRIFVANVTPLCQLFVSGAGALLFQSQDTTATYGPGGVHTLKTGLTTGVWYTAHIAFRPTGSGEVACWIDGALVYGPAAWIKSTASNVDWTAATDWRVGDNNTPGTALDGDVAFLYVALGGSTTYQDTTTLFYDAGGDVDLGVDGTFSGAVAPLIFFGGRQSADERRGYTAKGWNDLHNQGTGGDFATLTGSVTDV